MVFNAHAIQQWLREAQGRWTATVECFGISPSYLVMSWSNDKICLRRWARCATPSHVARPHAVLLVNTRQLHRLSGRASLPVTRRRAAIIEERAWETLHHRPGRLHRTVQHVVREITGVSRRLRRKGKTQLRTPSVHPSVCPILGYKSRLENQTVPITDQYSNLDWRTTFLTWPKYRPDMTREM